LFVDRLHLSLLSDPSFSSFQPLFQFRLSLSSVEEFEFKVEILLVEGGN
jgi:hypothetical protein